MKFFDKLGKVLVDNMFYTVLLVVAVILFLYFANGDLISGMFTAIFALVIYVCVSFLYQEYRKAPAAPAVKKAAVKKTARKKK